MKNTILKKTNGSRDAVTNVNGWKITPQRRMTYRFMKDTFPQHIVMSCSYCTAGPQQHPKRTGVGGAGVGAGGLCLVPAGASPTVARLVHDPLVFHWGVGHVCGGCWFCEFVRSVRGHRWRPAGLVRPVRAFSGRFCWLVCGSWAPCWSRRVLGGWVSRSCVRRPCRCLAKRCLWVIQLEQYH